MVDSVTYAILNPGDENVIKQTMIVIIAAGGVTLLSNFIRIVNGFVTQVQGRIVVDHMNNIIQSKAVEVDLEYYENAQYHDTLHRAQREASYRPISIINGLANILKNAISLAGVAWLLISFHWVIAIALLIAVVPGIIVRVLYSNKMFHLDRDTTQKERHSWYYAMILVMTVTAKEVRMFGFGQNFKQRYQIIRESLRKIKYRVDFNRSLFEFISQVVSIIAVFCTYGFIAFQTIKGITTLGDFVMYYQAFQRGQGFLRDMLGGIARVYENNLFLSNLYEFLDYEPKVLEPEHPVSVPQPINQGIKFEHIWFRYPNGDKDVIKDVNIEMQPGEVIALVGENGSGKTTLVKLLCRLHDPLRGQITIDNIDLRNFSKAALRQEISVIFQDFIQYQLSARDNIWIGDIHKPNDDDIIKLSAKSAGAHDVIRGLPSGYDTVLGKMFEHGEELSIGQWQKVALARAFFRDSQIMVLDEPTSAMDPQAEYEIFAKFKELIEDRSAILISHRLSTVRMADRIFVLHDGQIVESGTHDELVNKHGAYANLFEKQAKNYRE